MNGNFFRNSYNYHNRMPFGPIDNGMNPHFDLYQKENNKSDHNRMHPTSNGFKNQTYADTYLKQRMDQLKNYEKKSSNQRYQNFQKERQSSSSPKIRKPNGRQLSRNGIPQNPVIQSAEGQNIRIPIQEAQIHQSLTNTRIRKTISGQGTPVNQVKSNSLENSKHLTDLERKMKIIIQENDKLMEENQNLKKELENVKCLSNQSPSQANQMVADLQKQINFLKKENDFLKQYSMKNEVELSKSKDYLNRKMQEIDSKDSKIENLKADVNCLNSKVVDLSQTLTTVKNEVFKSKEPHPQQSMQKNWPGVYEGRLINTNRQVADRIHRLNH